MELLFLYAFQRKLVTCQQVAFTFSADTLGTCAIFEENVEHGKCLYC